MPVHACMGGRSRRTRADIAGVVCSIFGKHGSVSCLCMRLLVSAPEAQQGLTLRVTSFHIWLRLVTLFCSSFNVATPFGGSAFLLSFVPVHACMGGRSRSTHAPILTVLCAASLANTAVFRVCVAHCCFVVSPRRDERHRWGMHKSGPSPVKRFSLFKDSSLEGVCHRTKQYVLPSSHY